MTLRPVELMLVAAEIESTLVGCAVQKVVQPQARTLLLGCAPAWLLLSVDARFGRAHLVDKKPPGTGESAPPFCMLLRKHLVGARIVSFTAVPGERAAVLELVRRHAAAPDSEERWRLLVFLYGVGGRIVLVDGEGQERGAMGAASGPSVLPAPKIDDRGARFAPPEISSQIAAWYETELDTRRRAEWQTQVCAQARRELTRVERLIDQLEADLAKSAVAEALRRDADLLLAHLYEIPRGVTEVILNDDFAEGAPRRIVLDPARSPTDNAARLYRDYRRRVRGRVIVSERLERARRDVVRWQARLGDLEAGRVLAPVESPSPSAGSVPRTGRRGRRREAPRPPYHVYRAVNGDEILVGKNAAKNDELTFHVARGEDLWLHARDAAGAHVVVPLGGRTIAPETLLDAATLAVYHSPVRNETQADVTYAPRKLVRKPRGVAPGLVSVAGGKTMRLRLEADRLARLLGSRVTSEGA